MAYVTGSYIAVAVRRPSHHPSLLGMVIKINKKESCESHGTMISSKYIFQDMISMSMSMHLPVADNLMFIAFGRLDPISLQHGIVMIR